MAVSLSAVAAPAPVALAWGTGAGEGWTLDLAAIERAARSLGLTRPIRIGVTNGKGGRAYSGFHTWAAGAHRISIVRFQSRVSASRLVWHELAHALQLERDYACDDAAFDRDYRLAGGKSGAGYRANRFEVEARSYEPRGEQYPLVR